MMELNFEFIIRTLCFSKQHQRTFDAWKALATSMRTYINSKCISAALGVAASDLI